MATRTLTKEELAREVLKEVFGRTGCQEIKAALAKKGINATDEEIGYSLGYLDGLELITLDDQSRITQVTEKGRKKREDPSLPLNDKSK